MQQTGGAALARQLVREGATDIFALPGIQLDWAMDGLRQVRADIRVIVPRHEQATSYMADGYARTTGRVGTCMVVPGPGVLNAMAGLATAYASNSRVLCIAGDIKSSCRGVGLGLLHEVRGQTEILEKVTKWQARPVTPRDIPQAVHAAMRSASIGQPRPVAIEIAHDLLSATEDIPLVPIVADPGPAAPDARLVEAAASLLDGARFPVIFVGGGLLASHASAALAALAERLDAPVVMGENGRGALSDRHPLALNSLAGRAVFPHADVVLVVGSRFVDTAGGNPAWPSERARYIHVNLDPAAWAPPRRADVGIEADAAAALTALAAAVSRGNRKMGAQLDPVRAWAQGQSDLIEPQSSWLRALRAALPEDGFLVNELTQVGYLGRFAFPVYHANSFITPGYQGTLGFGYATALGVAAGNPGRAVVSINGDGGFSYNIQELATARKYGLAVVAVVFNDGHFGNVRTMQKEQFGEEFGADLYNPDFAKLADAYGLPYARAETPDALQELIRSAIAAGGPCLIEVPVSEMPSPWHLMRLQKLPFARAPQPPPPNPLGEPGAA